MVEVGESGPATSHDVRERRLWDAGWGGSLLDLRGIWRLKPSVPSDLLRERMGVLLRATQEARGAG